MKMNQQDRYCIKSRALRKTLEKIGTDAQKTDTLQVVLCGMGVSEGHNMNWATHIVHWYMPANSAEELAQKNWRLDRRVNGEWENLPISRRFSITYLVNEQRDTRQNLNDRFSRNRRFLGHRRFIAENEGHTFGPLFSMMNGLNVSGRNSHRGISRLHLMQFNVFWIIWRGEFQTIMVLHRILVTLLSFHR